MKSIIERKLLERNYNNLIFKNNRNVVSVSSALIRQLEVVNNGKTLTDSLYGKVKDEFEKNDIINCVLSVEWVKVTYTYCQNLYANWVPIDELKAW